MKTNVMRLFNLIIALFLAVPYLGCSEGNKAVFVDPRDRQTYEVIAIGSQEWLGSDLYFETPNSYCYDLKSENCVKYGRLYTYDDAKIACPQGWRLPTEMDWQKLEKELGMRENELDSIRVWRGTQEGKLLINKLGIEFGGFGKSKGSDFMGKDQLVYYWADTPGPSGSQFSMYRMFSKKTSKIYSDQVPKNDLCCIRCIKN